MTGATDEAVRPAAPPAARTGLPTLLVVSLGFFMVSLDSTIVNVALPTFGRELGAGLAALQWIVDGYTLVFAAALLTGGALGDGYGARRIFAIGLTVFSVASAACGLAPTTEALVAARFVQGLGAALLLPCSLALIREAYPDLAARARAVAAWAAAGGAAVAAGPVVGGVLIHAVGWRSIFLVNVVIGAVGLVVTATRVRPAPRVRRRIDVAGQLLAMVAVAGLVCVLIEGPRIGWTAPLVVAAIAATVLAVVGFVLAERRAPAPMLPPSLVRHPRFVGAALVGSLLNLAFYGQVFVLSLFFQQILHQSPLAAGLSFLPMTALIAAANLTAPRLAARIGSLPTILAGQVCFTLGLVATLSVRPGSSPWLIALALLPIGAGAGTSIPPLTSRLLDSVPGSLAGVASGAFNASRQVGGAVGVALAGAFLGAAHSAGFLHGMRTSLILAAAAVLASIALAAALLTRPDRDR